MMYDAILESINQLMDPVTVGFILLGVAVAFVIGVLPGLSGSVGLALLLPFIYGMDPYNAMALLIGMVAVTVTCDTYFSVLFGIPGSSSSQATIMDGHPMANKGEAQRALGAAFFASMLGGIIGACVLLFSIPIARPLVLRFGSPELFMMTLLAIGIVGFFVGERKIIGLASAFLGLLLGTVGGAPGTSEYRYTFDWLYLYSGIPLVVMVIGLFAIPELIQLLSSKKAVSTQGKLVSSSFDGVKDVLKNKLLVARSGMLGSLIGIIPGLGGSIVGWISYAFARATVKDSHSFGKGDVRGVIAPESSNNATDGGALVPTLLVGIPGSGSMAILMGGLVLLGFEAGPSMVEEENLPLVYLIAFTLVLANIFATVLCFVMAKPMSKITLIDPAKLFPFLIVAIFIGAYQASRHWGDFVLLVGIGVVAWLMKKLGWSRIPVLIGFVLAPGAENYLSLSFSRYGTDWMTRPGVLSIAALILLVFVGGALFKWYKKRRSVGLSLSDGIQG